MEDRQNGVDTIDWQDEVDLEAGPHHAEQRRLGGGSTKSSPSLSPRDPRRFSLPLSSLPIPEAAILAGGGRSLDIPRARANSLPWSTISALDQKIQLPAVRNATITPSPFATESRRPSAVPQIATFVGDKLVEESGVEVPRQRNDSRASVKSLERYYKSRRARFGWKKGKVAQTLFQYAMYLLLGCIIYFVFVGIPLWKGSVWWLWYSNTFCLIFGYHGPGH